MVDLRQCMFELNYDIVGITETWLNSNVPDSLIDVLGYDLVRLDRQTDTRGGGIIIYIKKGLHYEILPIHNLNLAIEQLWIKLIIKNNTFVLGTIYRRQEHAASEFFEDLENAIAYACSITNDIVVIGDFNINIQVTSLLSTQLLSSLDTVGLKQIIFEPTRVTRHSSTTIDLILVNENLQEIESGVIHDHKISDHSPIFCFYPIPSTTQPRTFIYRDFKYFNIEIFMHDLLAIPWNHIYQIQNANAKVRFLTENIQYLFDLHCPLRTATFRKQKLPWITDNIKYMIHLRNCALQRFKRTRNGGHWDYYKSLRNLVTASIKREKKHTLTFK